MAYAIQSKTYGAPTRADIKKNLENVCKQIDGCMYISDADYPAKLVALPEGALQGFYDEHSRMESVEICRKIAITLPGEESDVLAETAKKWGIYIIVPAKVIEPEIIPDRFFNTVFIIDPQGKIIHRYRKSRVFTLEASTTPHDVYDLWLEKVGKDPEEGVIFPHYEPPSGYSPASLRYVLKMGYDNACFAAAIINLAVKGFLTIEEDDDDYSLELTGEENIEMAPGEAAIVKKLFEKDTTYDLIANSPLMKKFIEALGGVVPIEADDSGKVTKIKLTQKNHRRIGGAVSAHKSSLQNNYEKIYFLTNTAFFTVGLIITFIVLLASIVSQPDSMDPAAIFMIAWLTGWTFAVFSLVKQVYLLWSNVNGILSALPAILMTLFALPFIGGELFGLYMLTELTSISMSFVLLIAAIINWLFYELLKAPTLAGQKLLDKIEGFKQYIDIAERHELDFKHPKGRSPELFEEYLPYALALDVEQQWGESFADVLAKAQAASGGYSPTWYHGTQWNNSNIGSFTSSLGSSFTSAIASSSTAPGSSSGGGGGGSSGGGGGGGGGGGW